MKYFDIKPEPKTQWEAWLQWRNWIVTQFHTRDWSSSKRRIEIRYE